MQLLEKFKILLVPCRQNRYIRNCVYISVVLNLKKRHMRKILTLLFVGISMISFGQEIEMKLNGFKIGQYREVPKNELKDILQSDKFEDGFEYEIYLVEKDTSAYMIFEYANYDLNTIWSIQLTGTKKGFNCGFKGLKLGMTTKEIQSITGKPTSIEDAGEYGKKWVYDKTNYTLEISKEGKLGGIKIIDMSRDFFPEPDLKKIPSYEEYSKIFNSGNRNEISNLLAPGMEIYKNDSVFFFKTSINNEIQNDKSGIFDLVEEMTEIINKTDFNDTLQYEENMRMTEFQGVLHVAKFNVDKEYYEIVFKYLFGRYLIWEMKIN